MADPEHPATVPARAADRSGQRRAGRSAGRMYSTELRTSVPVRRRGWLRWPLGAALVALVVLGVSVARAEPSPEDRVIFQYGVIPVRAWAFPGEPWAPVVLREAGAIGQPDPELGWRNVDVDGRYVDVRDGRRVTSAPAAPERAVVWLFGGSTTFGVGQRNRGTIASQMVRLAGRCGVPLRVENFGVQAYVNWQETEVFRRELAAGGRPDAAVFYDGSNEMAAADERVRYGLVDGDDPYVQTVTDEQRREREAASARARPVPAERRDALAATLAARQYGRGVRQARAAAEEAGVPVLHLWQPRLTTIPADRPRVQDVRDQLSWSDEWAARQAVRYESVRSRSGVDPIDISDAFDRVDQPVFYDEVHTNEHGALVVARRILAELSLRIPVLSGASC